MKIIFRLFKTLLLFLLAILAIPVTFFAVIFIAKLYAYMFVAGLALLPVCIVAMIYYWIYKLITAF